MSAARATAVALSKAASAARVPLAIDLEVCGWNLVGPPIETGRAISVSLSFGPRGSFFEGPACPIVLSAIPATSHLCWHGSFHAHVFSRSTRSTAFRIANAADDTLDMSLWARAGARAHGLPVLSQNALTVARADKSGAARVPENDLEPKAHLSEVLAALRTPLNPVGAELVGLDTPSDAQSDVADTETLASDPATRGAWLKAVSRDAEIVFWTWSWLADKLRSSPWKPDADLWPATSRARLNQYDGYVALGRPLRAACIAAEALGAPISQQELLRARDRATAAIEALKRAEEGQVTSAATAGLSRSVAQGVDEMGSLSSLRLDADEGEVEFVQEKHLGRAKLPLWPIASERADAVFDAISRSGARVHLAVGPHFVTGGAVSSLPLPRGIPSLPAKLFPLTAAPEEGVAAAAAAAREAVNAMLPSALGAPRGRSLVSIEFALPLAAAVAAHSARDVAAAALLFDSCDVRDPWARAAHALFGSRDAVARARAADTVLAAFTGVFPRAPGGVPPVDAALSAARACDDKLVQSEAYVSARLAAAWGEPFAVGADALTKLFHHAPLVRAAQARTLEGMARYGRVFSLGGRVVSAPLTLRRDSLAAASAAQEAWALHVRRDALGALTRASAADVVNAIFSRLTAAAETRDADASSPVFVHPRGVVLEGPSATAAAAARAATALVANFTTGDCVLGGLLRTKGAVRAIVSDGWRG